MQYGNKGIEKWAKKKSAHTKKCRTLKDSQKGVCQFVKIEYMEFKVINGKTRPAGKISALGLQIENKIFLNNGKFKFVNNKNLKIVARFKDIPLNVTEELKEKYKGVIYDKD